MFCPTCTAALSTVGEACPHCGGTFPFDVWATSGAVTATSGAQLEPGAMVGGRYRIEWFLAAGGMGEVYAAADTHAPAGGERVALKRLSHRLAGDAGLVARFVREATALATVDSPHVVRVLDLGSGVQEPYFVMELLDGESLAEALDRRGPFAQTDAVAAMVDVCRGLAAIHARGYVHRDVKPRNIMRCADRAVVLDFGVLRAAGPALTATGAILGTPAYLAPEQALDPRRAEPRSDLYSAGVSFFEMLTGRLPFSADTHVEMIAAHLRAQPPHVRDLAPGVSTDLDRIVARLLAKEVSARFSTAEQLASALQWARVDTP